jgi:hypothetical protein
MRCSDGVFKFRNFFMRHSPNQTLSMNSFQSLLPLLACNEAAMISVNTAKSAEGSRDVIGPGTAIKLEFPAFAG